MVAFNRPRQRNCRNPQRSLIHACANSANRERCAYRGQRYDFRGVDLLTRGQTLNPTELRALSP